VPAVTFFFWIVFSLAYDWRTIRRCSAELRGSLRRLASKGFL